MATTSCIYKITNKINEKFTNYEQNQYDTSTISVQKNLNDIIKNLIEKDISEDKNYKL